MEESLLPFFSLRLGGTNLIDGVIQATLAEIGLSEAVKALGVYVDVNPFQGTLARDELSGETNINCVFDGEIDAGEAS